MNLHIATPLAKKTTTGPTHETVLAVTHHTDSLFSFRITRPQGFRFRSGEFVMLGLMINGKPLLRAYSICSPSWSDHLEFYSVKVDNGPLTSHLQHIQAGDTVLLSRKAVGTLVLDALTHATTLYLLSTGTGFAPFASIIRDPETYEKFDQVIVTHTCREQTDLAYSQQLIADIKQHEFLSELTQGRLHYFDTVTREPYERTGRITALLRNNEFPQNFNLPTIAPDHSRIMICGAPEMLKDTRVLMKDYNLIEGSNAKPGDFVYEKAFVA